ncbi:MAG: sensor histidine kinase, partial [Bacteroidetes bacterium]|nr:sensor histidine kinase [Bacteroidota bacterium]
SIYIRTKSENGKIILNVKDEGIGIPEEDQKRLFEKFFRASNVGTSQGTGLGLHIMKQYVDKLHGTIQMKSQLGKGTEFTIEFGI